MSATTITVRYDGRTRKIVFPSLEMAQVCWDVLEPHFSMFSARPIKEDNESDPRLRPAEPAPPRVWPFAFPVPVSSPAPQVSDGADDTVAPFKSGGGGDFSGGGADASWQAPESTSAAPEPSPAPEPPAPEPSPAPEPPAPAPSTE